jgi:hypothetical protein
MEKVVVDLGILLNSNLKCGKAYCGKVKAIFNIGIIIKTFRGK